MLNESTQIWRKRGVKIETDQADVSQIPGEESLSSTRAFKSETGEISKTSVATTGRALIAQG